MRKPLLWFFDLDNTLHDATRAIFPAIHINMNAFIAEVLASNGRPATPESVNAVRLEYWRRYGATLLGMVRHHQVRVDDFLRESHRIENLPSLIRAERGMQHVLKRLPGRKLLFTNAPRHYSLEVIRHLGLHRHFADHIPIESMRVHGNLRPKPSRHLLHKWLAKVRISPRRCVLVEDTPETLKAAKAMGMKTVLVTQYRYKNPEDPHNVVNFAQLGRRNRPVYIDVKVKSLRQLAGYLNRLRT